MMSQVVVVGAGDWGQKLIRAFHDLGALAGIVESDPTGGGQLALPYPDVTLYTDYRDALQTGSALVIATPPATHYPLAHAALVAGRDVFVEKPMSLRTSDASDLADLADRQSSVLMVGYLSLYQPAIVWLQKYLATGQAGVIQHIATQQTGFDPVQPEETVWWSLAPQDVSVILSLLGNPSLESIQAAGQSMVQPNLEDQVHVNLTFGTGQTAHIHCSRFWPERRSQTIVLAEKQMIVYDALTQTIQIHHKGVGSGLNPPDQGCYSPSDFETFDPLHLECEHFLQCLQTRERPQSDGWSGVAVVHILEQVQEILRG
ncbi:MAG: Gfo/Idh/MocA family oxidoreductase [Leptolyngbyaceae cyanobacterium bins.59]|nr:Gfo/Idh/MocA family oxidoreductase [Leptolyngbyaceae cyanobacterium bins.59]